MKMIICAGLIIVITSITLCVEQETSEFKTSKISIFASKSEVKVDQTTEQVKKKEALKEELKKDTEVFSKAKDYETIRKKAEEEKAKALEEIRKAELKELEKKEAEKRKKAEGSSVKRYIPEIKREAIQESQGYKPQKAKISFKYNEEEIEKNLGKYRIGISSKGNLINLNFLESGELKRKESKQYGDSRNIIIRNKIAYSEIKKVDNYGIFNNRKRFFIKNMETQSLKSGEPGYEINFSKGEYEIF